MSECSTAMRVMRALLATLALIAMPVFAQEDITQVKRYALVIGINQYSDLSVPALSYAVNDAESMAKALTSQGYEIEAVLLDANATRSAILNKLIEVRGKIRAQDVFVLYFAGHGATNKYDQRAYWLNYDADRSKLEINGLPVREVAKLVARMPARRKLMILDHCYSGDVDAPSDYTIGDGPTTFKNTEVDLAESGEGALAQIPENNLTFNMAAARALAYEDARAHGLMTYFLLDALESPVQGAGETWSFYDLAVQIKEKVVAQATDRTIVQAPVFPTLGSRDATDNKWTPFLRPIADPTEDAKERLEMVRLYVNLGWISPNAQTELENLIARLSGASVESAAAEDWAVFAAMRWILESGAEEPTIANALSNLGESLRR